MKQPVLYPRIFTAFLLLLFTSGSMAGEAPGVLYWSAKTSLSLPVSGVLSEVLVSPGQVIKQGELMLKLDTRRVKAQLRAAKARLSRFKPSRDEAQRELERAEELFDRTVLSEVELQQAKIDFAEKDAALQEAHAAVVEAGLNLEYSELKAPFDLIVLNVRVVKGQAIINELKSTPLIEIVKNHLAVSVSIPATKLVGAGMGTKVTISYGDKKIPGHISTVDFDPGSQRSLINIAIDDQQSVSGAVGNPVQVTWP